jgi:hypothetical protein
MQGFGATAAAPVVVHRDSSNGSSRVAADCCRPTAAAARVAKHRIQRCTHYSVVCQTVLQLCSMCVALYTFRVSG